MCFTLLTKLKNIVVQRKVHSLLERYQVEVLHHTPGRVRVRIKRWQDNRVLLERLLEDMRNDPAVESVAFTEETGSILIHYRQDQVKEATTHERWQELFKNYFG